jgi:hypothetical protein
MENKKVCNEELLSIFNDPKREAEIKNSYNCKMVEKQKRMLKKAIKFAAIGVSFGILGCFNWMQPIIASVAAMLFGFYSMFLLGRWFENRKCWGQK